MYQDSSDNIYYNITIFPKKNNDYNTMNIQKSEYASYIENRTNAIVDNPSDYYLAFVRFSIPALPIPLFICPIVENQPNIILPYPIPAINNLHLPSPNFTPFALKFTYLNNVIQENIIYKPQNNATIPVLEGGKYISNNNYYYVYSYEWFLEMINDTLVDMFKRLQLIDASFVDSPYFIFDDNNDTISFIVPTNYTTKNVKISMNYKLRVFLSGFTSYTDYNASTGELWYDFIILNTGNYNGYAEPPAPITNPPAYIRVFEEYSSLNYWPSVKKIVWLSGSLPIRYEMTTNSDNIGGQAVSQPIITDFFPTFDRSAGDSRSILSYYQNGPYRLINLTSTTPLTKIDIKAMWEDSYGNLYEIPLVYGQVIDLKLAFFKKKNFNQYNK